MVQKLVHKTVLQRVIKPITQIQPTALKSLNYRLLEAKRVFWGEHQSSVDLTWSSVNRRYQWPSDGRTGLERLAQPGMQIFRCHWTLRGPWSSSWELRAVPGTAGAQAFEQHVQIKNKTSKNKTSTRRKIINPKLRYCFESGSLETVCIYRISKQMLFSNLLVSNTASLQNTLSCLSYFPRTC